MDDDVNRVWLTRSELSDLDAIVVCWNLDRFARGLLPLSRGEALTLILAGTRKLVCMPSRKE